MRILIAYGSTHRSTAEIATHLADRLRDHHQEVLATDVRGLRRNFDASRFDAIIVGGRVWGNRYPRRVARFVRENLDALRSRPSAFYSVCLWNVSKVEQHRAEARELPRRFVAAMGWKPDVVEVIAGTLALSKYAFGIGFLGRPLMAAIWKPDLGRLDPTRDHCFTDWVQVDAFADSFLHLAVFGPGAQRQPPSGAHAWPGRGAHT